MKELEQVGEQSKVDVEGVPPPHKKLTAINRTTVATNLTLSLILLGGIGWFELVKHQYEDLKAQERKDYNNLIDRERKDSTQALDNLFGQPWFSGFNSDLPDIQPDAVNQDIRPLQQSLNYYQKTDSLNKIFYDFAKRSNSPDALETFHQMALDHLFDGLRTLNTVKKAKVATFSNENGTQIVTLDKETYDLSNPLQFQSLFAMINLQLDAASLQAEGIPNNAYSQKRQLINKIQNNLEQEVVKWLKNQDLTVGFTKNGTLLVDAGSLARFAQTLKIVNQLGYPNPRSGFFGPSKDWGGRYITQGDNSSEDTAIDYNDPYGSVDSLPHEIGHYVSDAASSINPEFSLASFDKLMSQVEQQNLGQVKDEKNPYYYLNPKDQRNRKEQYAEFFARYLRDGDALKQQITWMSEVDPAAAQILLTEFSFFQKLFNGQEYTSGIFTQELNKQLEKYPQTPEQAYAIGHSVIISDQDTKTPGVLLRQFPGGQVTPDSPAVFNNDLVKIINGPFIFQRQVYNPETNESEYKDMRWWQVELTIQGSVSRRAVGMRFGNIGWIPETNMGEDLSQFKIIQP